ncbi:MAG: GNAT family N-acetyltransferase [Planctomycetes bacterium]|nr:GNAT family N-acetyltransferase [Planctomycetota bacterium]
MSTTISPASVRRTVKRSAASRGKPGQAKRLASGKSAELGKSAEPAKEARSTAKRATTESRTATEAADQPAVETKPAVVETPAPAAREATRPRRSSRRRAKAHSPSDNAQAREGLRLISATASDHLAIAEFFKSAFPSPQRDGFASSLDDPLYEPCDRWLVRRGTQVLAHVQTVRREMRFDQVDLPVSGLTCLGTLPEYRNLGMAGALVRRAERAMAADGAVIGLTRTRFPAFFASEGWAVCGRHSHSRANPREVLAQLSARGLAASDDQLVIRPWRQVELPALMRLYSERISRAAGPLLRTEATWRWLVSRQNVDHLFVAIEGPDKFDWQAATLPIVGYMLMKEDRVIELVGAPSAPSTSPLLEQARHGVAEQLLARACAEAIERDDYAVQLHSPADDSLHELFRAAGGETNFGEQHQGESYMMKVFDLPGLLRRLAPVLQRRAAEAAGSRAVELGLLVDGERLKLAVSRRGVRFGRGQLGRNYLRLSRDELTRLLLGHVDIDADRESGALKASNRTAAKLATVLFPQVPYWRAPWDDVVG